MDINNLAVEDSEENEKKCYWKVEERGPLLYVSAAENLTELCPELFGFWAFWADLLVIFFFLYFHLLFYSFRDFNFIF